MYQLELNDVDRTGTRIGRTWECVPKLLAALPDLDTLTVGLDNVLPSSEDRREFQNISFTPPCPASPQMRSANLLHSFADATEGDLGSLHSFIGELEAWTGKEGVRAAEDNEMLKRVLRDRLGIQPT
jgi:hypothetical protein